MEPYYQDDAVTLYHGDCREILPTLGRFDLLLTDPPYGIKRDTGIGGKGFDGFGNRKIRRPKKYAGGWDDKSARPNDLFVIASHAEDSIIWGGNYFSGTLPQANKWLVWNKMQTMRSYSDAELAWTSLSGTAVKMFTYNGSGLMAAEKSRVHPTQKPIALMRWCLTFAPDAQTILDPFAGSCTTGVAAKLEGRKATLIEMEERYCEVGAKRLSQGVLF